MVLAIPQISGTNQEGAFCVALKYQYKEFKSCFDKKKEIRNRRGTPSENFESFYETISTLLDRLDTPMPEHELKELLYVPIFSITHLRKLVMCESLLGEECFRKGMPERLNPNVNSRRLGFRLPRRPYRGI